MFLATSDILNWALPIATGLLIGYFIATRNKDYKEHIHLLEAEEFRANMRKGQLIDIRKDDQYQLEKINGSRNFPGRSVFGNLAKIRQDQAVFLYSDQDRGKIRSVAKKLAKKGYRPVYILKNGFAQWPFVRK
ncbi:MAG: rhodanese-like domain-containing protein [Bacilli bacterium]|nr:rhodanese-like domain-containing protein [Bacilli bacterium]MBN2877415.1 rhodanese-like domain-containing protein [Bacilli bacterium]